MGRTKRTQVALYLDPDKAEALQRAAVARGRTQQELLREAIDRMLETHEWKRTRRTDGRGNVHQLVKKPPRPK